MDGNVCEVHAGRIQMRKTTDKEFCAASKFGMHIWKSMAQGALKNHLWRKGWENVCR